MGGNEKNEIFRQMRKEPELRFSNGPSGEIYAFKDIPYANKVLGFLASSDRIILAKSRQMLISNLLLAHAVRSAFMEDGHSVLFVVKNLSDISVMMMKLKNILNCSGIESEIKGKKVILGGNSRIVFTNSTKHSLIGHAFDTLILDECAYFNSLEEYFKQLANTAKQGAQIILSSTPKKDSYFNYLFLSESGYTTKKLTYSENPYINEENIRDMASKLTTASAKEELYCEVLHKLFNKKTQMVTFRLDEKLLEAVLQKNKLDNLSLTDYLTRLIKSDLSI